MTSLEQTRSHKVAIPAERKFGYSCDTFRGAERHAQVHEILSWSPDSDTQGRYGRCGGRAAGGPRGGPPGGGGGLGSTFGSAPVVRARGPAPPPCSTPRA